MLTCRKAYITCADPLAVTQRSSTSHLANSIIARPTHHPPARTMSAIIDPNISSITFPPIDFTTLARRRIAILATESIEKAFVAEHLNDADPRTLRAWLFRGESPVDALVPIGLDSLFASPYTADFVAEAVRWRGFKKLSRSQTRNLPSHHLEQPHTLRNPRWPFNNVLLRRMPCRSLRPHTRSLSTSTCLSTNFTTRTSSTRHGNSSSTSIYRCHRGPPMPHLEMPGRRRVNQQKQRSV